MKIVKADSKRSEYKRFENWDLKNTRNLKKFDCWDEDKTPEEWVRVCLEMGNVAHG